MHARSNSAMPNHIRQLFVTLLTFGDPADVEGLFPRHFDAMAENQRDVTERQKRLNIIQILNSHLQPFSIQMSNLIDLPAFFGDALDDNNMSLPNNDDTIHDNNDDVEGIVQP
jgi:hypothetical protein